MKKKITLIGAGQIGGTLAHLIALKDLADVVLFDVAAGIAKGKALDIAQSSPVDGFNINLSGTNNYDDTKNSDVIIITAGVPRKPGMTRDDLLEINLKIIKQVAEGIKKTSPNAFVICITNPLDVIVMALQKYSSLPKNKVIGMAGILDSSRFIYFLSQELKVPVDKIKSFVLGGHGDSMVAMLGSTEVDGQKITDLIKEGKISKERLDQIVDRTKKGGAVDYATSLKNLRIGQIAEENKLTLINLVESGGANLPDQDKVFTNYGKMFYDMSRRSKKGIMTISIVFGNATAGGAYVPGMSDFNIMQKDQAKVFLAGPPLVKMATGEESSDEELGGAKMHRSTRNNVGNKMAVLFVERKSKTEIIDDIPEVINYFEKRIISLATIQSALASQFRITGLDSPEEASELALLLRAGALAAPMDFVEEGTIGPSLGADNIKLGIQSLVLGLSLVLLFMVFYYKVFDNLWCKVNKGNHLSN